MPVTVYFYWDDVREEAEILKDQVIVTKYKRVIKGYKEYGQHHSMSTTALDVKFGVAKHLFRTSNEGEVYSGNNHYKSTHKMFCGNTNNMKAFK